MTRLKAHFAHGGRVDDGRELLDVVDDHLDRVRQKGDETSKMRTGTESIVATHAGRSTVQLDGSMHVLQMGTL